MQFLAILRTRPETTREQIGPVLRPEAAKAWELVAAGALRSVHYITGPHGPAGAALLLEAADAKEAEAHVASLPLVAQALVGFELLPLAPFTGFASLFAAP